MKTYKIYRFAYRDCLEQITVPDNTVFHVLDRHEQFKETEYGKINQNDYIALILYTKENWNILSKSENQTLTLNYYNVSDKWIVIILRDVSKIDENFPLSNDLLIFPECYIKIRAINQIQSNEKSLKEIVNMSKSEQDTYIRPVISYIKIHGFSKKQYGLLSVTRVDTGSWVDEQKIYNICREDESISEVLGCNNFIETDKCDEQEFLSVLTKVFNIIK